MTNIFSKLVKLPHSEGIVPLKEFPVKKLWKKKKKKSVRMHMRVYEVTRKCCFKMEKPSKTRVRQKGGKANKESALERRPISDGISPERSLFPKILERRDTWLVGFGRKQKKYKIK